MLLSDRTQGHYKHDLKNAEVTQISSLPGRNSSGPVNLTTCNHFLSCFPFSRQASSIFFTHINCTSNKLAVDFWRFGSAISITNQKIQHTNCSSEPNTITCVKSHTLLESALLLVQTFYYFCMHLFSVSWQVYLLSSLSVNTHLWWYLTFHLS